MRWDEMNEVSRARLFLTTIRRQFIFCVRTCADELRQTKPLSVFVQQAAAARCIGYVCYSNTTVYYGIHERSVA